MKPLYLLALIPAVAWGDGWGVGSTAPMPLGGSRMVEDVEPDCHNGHCHCCLAIDPALLPKGPGPGEMWIGNGPQVTIRGEIRCVDPKSTLTIRAEALGVTIECEGEK